MSGFADVIKRIRLERRMTQEEFASFLGTSKQNISRYEKGEVSPKISTAAAIASKLGITLEQLNGGKQQRVDGLSDDEAALLESYRALNAAGQSIALNTVKGLAGNPDLVKDTTSRSMAG